MKKLYKDNAKTIKGAVLKEIQPSHFYLIDIEVVSQQSLMSLTKRLSISVFLDGSLMLSDKERQPLKSI